MHKKIKSRFIITFLESVTKKCPYDFKFFTIRPNYTGNIETINTKTNFKKLLFTYISQDKVLPIVILQVFSPTTDLNSKTNLA